MSDHAKTEDLTVAFAAEIFAQLSAAEQETIIAMIKSLLSEQ